MNIENLATKLIRKFIPYYILKWIPSFYYFINKYRYKLIRRASVQKETSVAKARRVKENFFDFYCKGNGIDIGYGGDAITDNCDTWDIENGDAHYINKFISKKFNYIYSSHLLEHLENPHLALTNWWKILDTDGFLILYVPDRDLYEKKKTLPSKFSLDHKYFFTVDEDDPPHTLGLIPLIEKCLSNYKIIYAKVCNEGCTITDPNIHSNGEYSIEMVVKKNG